jgi:pimeloyl-[acyl-carrier protein] synthase
MRESHPVHHLASAGTWFVTGHRECLKVLSDSRFSAQHGQSLRLRSHTLPTTMLTADPPEHTRLRASVADAFNPAGMAATRTWMRPMVIESVRQFGQALASGVELDLVSDLAEPLAVAVLGRFLGLHESDLPSLASWGRAVSVNLDPFADPGAGDISAMAMQEMLERFADLLHTPANSGGALAVLSRSHAAGFISPAEVLATAGLLVVGGLDPLAAVVSNAAAALLAAPPGRARTRTRTRTAVDELLRIDAPIQFTARMATQAVQLADREIPAGDHLVLLLGAANRDPTRFADPDSVILDRRTNPHLSFGAGAHVCLGAPLVRTFGALLVDALPASLPPIEVVKEVRADAVVPRRHSHLVLRRSDRHL